jgi:vacuolar-type H+-ATPase subunit F/Vma7
MKTSHALAYLGNLQDAAGWRLAGACAVTPDPGGEVQALAAMMGTASVVLMSTEVARALPPDVLEPALTALQPLVLVLPDDAGGQTTAIDPAERVRRQLGIEQDPADVHPAGAP